MPISHLSLATGASKWAAMRSFYLTALAPLGYSIYFEKENYMLGLKPQNGPPDFWLHAGNGDQAPYGGTDVENRPGKAHVAFDVENWDMVDKFFEAAIAAGGTSNGGPGLRPQFSKAYYAAFVLDPLGNNIEAVHYRPQE